MRYRYPLAALAALLVALPAVAQDYGVISQADLAANTGLTDPEPRCLFASDGGVIFYDSNSGDLAFYDPVNTGDAGPFVSNADIDAAAGFDVDRCHDLTFQSEGGVARTFVAVGDGTDEAVLLFDGDGDTLTRLADATNAAGTYALAPIGTTLYLGRVEFRGAPEDGVYAINTTGADQAPTGVFVDADLDITDMVSDGTDLYLVSSEFGGGTFDNAVVELSDLAGTPAAAAFQPCAGGTPVFVNCGDGGLEEITTGSIGGTDYLFVSNNDFADTVVGAFEFDSTFDRYVFSEVALVADAAISETAYSTAFDGYLAFDDANDVFYVAGRDRTNDGSEAEAIYTASNPFAVATAAETPVGTALSVTNPVRGRATIEVALDVASARGRILAYDLMGRVVAEVHDGPIANGQRFAFDASALAAGAYVIRMESDRGARVRTVTVVR